MRENRSQQRAFAPYLPQRKSLLHNILGRWSVCSQPAPICSVFFLRSDRYSAHNSTNYRGCGEGSNVMGGSRKKETPSG